MLKAIAPMPRTFDRAKLREPLVSIIVTHHNYSGHLRDCLLSIADQTHEKWVCMVVDDASDADQLKAAEAIVRDMGDPRFQLMSLGNNLGQIPAFFLALANTGGEFVCPLDPDDRYEPDFLEEMLAAHLNPVRYVPLVSCEQMLMRGNEVITGVHTGHAAKLLEGNGAGIEVRPDLHYFPAASEKWHWSSTSGMMFRRPALKVLRPHGEIRWKRQLDAWLAPGAHMLGGSMFLNKALVYRGVHGDNSWLREDVWAMGQSARMASVGAEIRADVRAVIIANGHEADLARAKRGKRTMAQRLRRSVEKRWRRWLGRTA